MPRTKRVNRTPSYREGIAWIAVNDNAWDDDPRKTRGDETPGGAQQRCREAIAGYISTLLLADLFGADPAIVAHDVCRVRARYLEAQELKGRS